ncbi:hypothetical protein M9Y10_033820 [Tritrichomonas musculus]|uniref:Dynein heavy chain linker domain-containing protein n=1 Tax=Tritrichomonas musculus TaxID=1915356 RepID=A0ABR2KD71_9EUKA
MSLESISRSLRNFLNDSTRSDVDHRASWQKLRSEFLDIGNRKIVLEPTPEIIKMIKQIHNTSGFGEILTDAQINRVFPSLKYKYHLVKAPNEPKQAIKIRAPTTAAPKSARTRSKLNTSTNLGYQTEIPPLTLKPIDKGPKTARFKTTRIDPDNQDPMKPFPDELPPGPPKITDLIPNLSVDEKTQKLIDDASTPRKRWVNGFTLENERDAIKYVAAVDPKHDFLQFQFGTNDIKEPFSFRVKRQIKGRNNEDFNTVTKRGVLAAEHRGHSEFTSLHQYVENKTQYEMIQNIAIFAQFRLYKHFQFWRLNTVRKLFSKRVHRFADDCWKAKPQYPSVIFDFRQHLLSLRQMNLFPIKTVDGELEFKTLQKILAEAREDTYHLISTVSSEIRVVLNNLSKELNEYYEFITSERATDYLEMKKIPAELFSAAKMPFKHGQSIVEAEILKKKHEKTIEVAKQDLDSLQPFLQMCDKMVIQLFLDIVTKQFKDFVKVFTNPNHDVLMRTFIVYESETLMFEPSYRELSMMLNEHLDSLFDLFKSFIRPCMIDHKGSGKFLDFKMLKIRLDDIIKRDPIFSADLQSLKDMVELAYKEARETYDTYYDPSMTVYKFRDNWPEMKVRETDPTVYINNLNDLTKLKELIATFKMNTTHQFLVCDTKQLRTNLLDTLTSTIEENNTILFRNFEQLCTDNGTEIKQLMLTLQDPDDSLESQAEFNLSINKANAALPHIDGKVQIIDNIFERAKECAKLLVPILEASLNEIHDNYNNFKQTLESAQQKMDAMRKDTIDKLIEKQRELEKQMDALDKRTKSEFSTVEVTVSPESAIADLTVALEKTEELSLEVKAFESMATKLNYKDFDFSQLSRTKNELEMNLNNWKTYQKFMEDISEYSDADVMNVNYSELITFLNSHNEREMRSANHPLFDKMANSLANLYQYINFFTLLTKVDLNEERWTEIGKLVEISFDKLQEMKLKRFLSQKILTNMEKIKSYILSLQQQADMSQSFDNMILDMRALVLRLIYSPVTKMKIVTFPSLHEAMQKCEHYVLYLHSLESSPFYTTIQQQVEFWMSKLKMSMNILHAINSFQTKFVYFSTATVASFYETHFPVEFHHLKFITDFYKNFTDQLEIDAHVLSLISKTDEQLEDQEKQKKKFSNKVKIPNEEIDRVIDQVFLERKYSTTNPKNSTYRYKMMAKNYKVPSPSAAAAKLVVNKELNKPITLGEVVLYQGNLLIQCLNEGQMRCEILLENVSHLLDLHRQKFPRFFFCTDKQILEILLACSNVKYLTDDLQPVFPALSRFHVSIVDTARVMGIINSSGETYQFSSDFDYENLSVVELLARTEREMKNSVRSTILDALRSREYTEPSKWLIRFPVQTVVIAENAHFTQDITDTIHKVTTKPDFTNKFNEIGEFINSCNEFIREFPAKIEQVSTLIGLKIRHRDMLQGLNDLDAVSVDTFEWKRHISHVIKLEKGIEQIYTQIGTFTIPYGYEMLSKMDIGIMTDQEAAAALALASCMNQPEFALCKQMNGQRNVVKAFAESCGLPVFDVYSNCLRNVFAGASAVHSIVRLHEVKELPALFPNFYGLIEARMKIMKCETHFRDFDRSNWCSLIHIDEEEVPSWLKQRLRPINLISEPPSEILMRLTQIRKDFHFTEDTPIEFAVRAIQKPKGEELLDNPVISSPRTKLLDDSVESKELKFYFNLPEFILTGKFVTMEEPLILNVPLFFEGKINELYDIVEEFDAISPHSQSQDFPIRPFPVHIVCYSTDRLSTVLTILASFKESIKSVRPHLSMISTTANKIELGIIGYRPIIFDIIEEKTADPLFLVKMPVFTPRMILDLIVQHPDFVNFKDDIMSFALPFLETNLKTKSNEEVLNLIKTKMCLIHQVYGSENSIQMIHLSESVFNDALHLASITDEDVLKLPLKYQLNIIIPGPISSGKRSYAKKYVAKRAAPQDLIFYSSPFNETLAMTIMDNVKLIARGIYGPPETKRIFLCIFDYQLATPYIKDFVTSFLLHQSVYSKVEGKYVTIERMQLIITTTDIQSIYKLNCPCFVIDQFESSQLDFTQFQSNNNIVTPDLADILKKLTIDERRFSLASRFMSILKTPLDSSFIGEADRFLVLFSLFYSDKDLETVMPIFNANMAQVKKMQCHNQNLAYSMSDTHLCSRLIDVINLGMSCILIYQDATIYQYIKNCEFVVLNSHFRTQLFSAMVKVSQDKKKTTFLLNMKILSISEVFNILDFFLFNSENPDSSLIFEAADLQIFKHYMDPRSEERDVISKLLNLVSFIIICDEDDYKNLPELFKAKMITIRRQDCEDITLKQSERAPFVDSLLQYVSLDARTFDGLVVKEAKKYRERYQEFIDETQVIIDFFSTLTSMKNKMENQSGAVMSESESELQNKLDSLDSKMNEAKKKKEEFEEQMKTKTNELSLLQAKIAVQAPNEVSVAVAALCAFSLEDQVDQINQWLSKKDDFYIFVNVFKELFHFITPANFTDTSPNSTYCKLVSSIRQYNLADNNAMFSQKLPKLGLKGESPAAAILNQMELKEGNQIPTISPIPIVNSMLIWLSVAVKYCSWQDDMNEVTASLTQLKNRNNTNDEKLRELQQEYDELNKNSLLKNNGMEIPSWLLSAWNKDENDVRKLITLLDDNSRYLTKMVSTSVHSEKLINSYAALSVAYKNGFCQLSPQERKEFLKFCKMEHMFDPLCFVEKGIEVELFFPVEKLLSLFSPDFQSSTMQMLNTLPVFDQIVFSGIVPSYSRFFHTQVKENESEPLLARPIQVFYDPNDVTNQMLVSNHPAARVAFTSSNIADNLYNAIVDGETLIVHIDSVKSGKKFFATVLHFILHINATKTIQFDETSKPINHNFQMFVLTKIHPSLFFNESEDKRKIDKCHFSVNQNDVIFADMSVLKPQNTQWFELTSVFAVNCQIEQFFVDLLETITNKLNDIFTGLHRLSEFSHGTWPEYFENPAKQLSLRNLLETTLNSHETLENSIVTFKSIIKQNGDHPQSVSKYSLFVSLLRDLCSDLSVYYTLNRNGSGDINNMNLEQLIMQQESRGNKDSASCSVAVDLDESNSASDGSYRCKSQFLLQNSNDQVVYQVLSAVRYYARSDDRGPMAPLSAINNLQEIIFDIIQCLPNKQRVFFQAKYETNRLKGIASNTHLLFDASFPNLSERPLNTLLPQLIGYVSQRFPNIQRQYFTFATPDSIPFPSGRPVIVVVDDLIPTDFYARVISQHLPQKKMMLLTIGSFSNPGLSSPESFANIIRGCKNRKAVFLVNYDELMPDYTIDSIVYYSHQNQFNNYFIVINELLFYKTKLLPLIPNATVVKIAKPYTASGASRLISLFPSFRAESLRYEIPLIYLLMLLGHRNDFIFKFHQILPYALITRELWVSGQFSNQIAREFWMNMMSLLATTLTNDDVVRTSYQSILKYFFSHNTPSIPGEQRVEFENDTILSSEFPPNPPDIGRVIEEDESSFARPNYNWKNRKEISHLIANNEIEFKVGQPPPPAVRNVRFADTSNTDKEEDESNTDKEESPNSSLQFSPIVLRENSILIIKHCEIVNARMSFQTGEVSVTGSRFVDLYVYEKKSQQSLLVNDQNNQNDGDSTNNSHIEDTSEEKSIFDSKDIDDIPIVDGEEEIGTVKIKRPGNKLTWSMVGVKIVLPDFTTAAEYETVV